MNHTSMPTADKNDCCGQVPGMCYVPWQTFGKTYDPMRGLSSGTIFPDLDKPFTAQCNLMMGGRRR